MLMIIDMTFCIKCMTYTYLYVPTPVDGYFDFYLLHRLTLFFRSQNFEIYYCFGFGTIPTIFSGNANLGGYFLGMSFLTGIILDVRFQNIYIYIFVMYFK